VLGPLQSWLLVSRWLHFPNTGSVRSRYVLQAHLKISAVHIFHD